MNSNYSKWQQDGSIPIVQGTHLSPVAVYGEDQTFPETHHSKAVKQPKVFNDIFWAVLFIFHLIAIAALAIVYYPQLEDNNGGGRRSLIEDGQAPMSYVMSSIQDHVNFDYFHRSLEGDYYQANPDGLLSLIFVTLIVSFILSISSLGMIIRHAEMLIKTSLIFNIVIGLLTAIAGFQLGSTEAGVMGLIFFLISLCYTCAVWNRIPFAAINLVTASTAIKANMGLTFFAYGAIVMYGLWFSLWSVSTYATVFVLGECNEDGECENEINGFLIFFLLLSLYWTMQVIKNVVHVTVAGTVGTWWWTPSEASSCCSRAIMESNNRAMTYSFGSICFGSLLVAIVQTIRSALQSARDQDDGILSCIADCLLSCLEAILEMFNEWAFVYVGLYGYNYIDSAKNVMTLFRARGWTAIITDYMVDRVLAMISVGVGLVAGGFAALFSYLFSMNLEGIAFTTGFLVGLLLTSILLGLVSSSVNTVIVCYAEDPASFERNHNELSIRMSGVWRNTFPNEFQY